MRTPFQVGLIGVGGIGSYHLAALEALECRGLVRLVAVADPDSARHAAIKDRLSRRQVSWHDDYRDLLSREGELHGVAIATPIPLHYKMTRDCIARGAFVLLEKPPVPSIQQLENLIGADLPNRVAVGFQMITSQCVQQAKEALVRGGVGDIMDIRACGCWPRLDTYYHRAGWAGKMLLDGEPVFDGPATNALAHLIHNIMYFAAPGRADYDSPVEVQGELYRARPIQSYDVACVRGRFRSGIRFAAAMTHATESHMPFSIEVRGTKGSLCISQDGGRLDGSGLPPIQYCQSTDELLMNCHEEFVELMKGERGAASTDLADCRGYVLATDGMLASSGGIRDIGSAFLRTYYSKGDRGFDVMNLRQMVEETFRTGRLFSEQGAAWAKPGVPVSLEAFKEIDFSTYSLSEKGSAPPAERPIGAEA